MPRAQLDGFCPNAECIVLMPVTSADLDTMTPQQIATTRFYCLALSPNESRRTTIAYLRTHAERGELFIEVE